MGTGIPSPQFGTAGFGQSSIPSGEMVCGLARWIIGDTVIPGGQIYTNNFLQGGPGGYPNIGPYQSAYQWLIERLTTNSDRRASRFSYAVINPNIGYVNPQSIGLFTMGYPIDIWERLAGTVYAAQSVMTVPPTPTGVDGYVEVGVQHNGAIPSGQLLDTYLFMGVSDDINSDWTVNVPDSTHIRLMGCTASGAWTNPSGLMVVSAQPWPSSPMFRDWDLNDVPLPPGVTSQTMFGRWAWMNGALRFPPVTMAREIRIKYNLAANPPADLTVGIGIADSLNVLAYRTIAIAARAKGNVNADTWDAKAEMLLKEFLQPSTKDLQRERFLTPRFRWRRNTGLYIPY